MDNLNDFNGVPLEKDTTTFFSHVFNFDTDTKNEILNLAQYIIIAIIPIVMLNKSVQHIFPVIDESATTFTLLGEVIGQLVYIFVALIFIHRVITYIPTYSKVAYTGVNLLSVILPFLVIILSLQTKVGKKVEILVQRAKDAYMGKETNQEETHEMPVIMPPTIPAAIPTHQPSKPEHHELTVPPHETGLQSNVMTQHMRDGNTSQTVTPNFNTMYTPGGDNIEPMSLGNNSNYAAF